MTEPPTTKASTSSRVEEVIRVLREEILRGQYRPGERLPSERDLATRFGTNRGAIREGLKKLEQMGIADINPGGVRVVPVEEATLDVLGHLLDLETVPNARLVGQFFDVLSVLMAMSARTAMRAASDEELVRMRAIVAALTETGGDPEQDALLWKELGQLFTEINGNLVLRLILNGLKTQFVERLKARTRPPVAAADGQIQPILERMLNGIDARDAAGFADAISDHFQVVRDIVHEALTQTPETDMNSASSRSVSHG